MIDDVPSPAFADFGKPASLRSKDGTSIMETLGLYDEAETERYTDNGTVRSRQPQITVPATAGEPFHEGDKIILDGREYEILDNFTDNAVTTYNVRKLI